MQFRVGIENNNEGIRSIAWLLEHPGCYAYGSNEQEAMANSVQAIYEYAVWMAGHGQAWLASDITIEIIPEQRWNNYRINEMYDRVERGGYEVSPFFQHDWKPLTFWSPRKLLRRALWHERDHTEHIRKVLQ